MFGRVGCHAGAARVVLVGVVTSTLWAGALVGVAGAAVASIVTSATPSVTLGNPISDTASVTGDPAGPAPTGTVTFTVFGPANPTCAGPPIFTSSARPLVGGSAPTASSVPFTPFTPGSYNWVAVYNGDVNYPPTASPCGAPGETSVVRPLPTVQVDKTATPLSLPAPGGSFTFTIVVSNTSSEALTITSLTDDVYGNVATQGTCGTAIGTVLQAAPGPGSTYSCSFTGMFTGAAGSTQTDVVTVSAVNSAGVAVTDSDDAVVSLTPVPPEERVADFDGNGTTDVSVFRPANSTWYLRTASPTAVVWGAAGDIPVPGDYDGNGTTDVAVYRPGNGSWYLRTASPTAAVWGAAGDVPVPGDYDGNGSTDVAVYRPSNGAWYLRTASPTAVVWGVSGDIPVPGDYDGNGTTDVAVYRPGNGSWYLRTASPTAVVWGAAGDIPVPGKYDHGDVTDIAVFRPGNGTWYLRTFNPAPTAVVWGQNGDIPEPGDYDGDGRTDLAVFRPGNSTWYLRTFSPTAVVWGANGDQPLPLPQAVDKVFFP